MHHPTRAQRLNTILWEVWKENNCGRCCYCKDKQLMTAGGYYRHFRRWHLGSFHEIEIREKLIKEGLMEE